MRLLILPAVVLAVVGLVPSTTSTTGSDVPARAADEPLTLVDWNLHYGVSPLTAVDLEGIAATIEAQDPDVVTLQEVQRGWVFGGGSDMATWLAHRLGMTIRFAPAADHQFGNAVLARSELTDVVVHPLPYGAGPQSRSALSTTLTTADGTPLRVTSVHMQHRESNTPTRLEQLTALAEAEPVDAARDPRRRLQRRAGLAGDRAAGGRGLGPGRTTTSLTSPAIDPAYKIDWVFGQGVTFLQASAAITCPVRPPPAGRRVLRRRLTAAQHAGHTGSMTPRQPLPSRPVADPRAVVVGPTYRITVLTDGLVRLEHSAGRRCSRTARRRSRCTATCRCRTSGSSRPRPTSRSSRTGSTSSTTAARSARAA